MCTWLLCLGLWNQTGHRSQSIHSDHTEMTRWWLLEKTEFLLASVELHPAKITDKLSTCRTVTMYSKFPFSDNTTTTTTILRPLSRDHPGEPVPEENFWTWRCKGRPTEADTKTIRLGATPSGLTSAHLHHPPLFLQARSPSCCPTNSVKALNSTIAHYMPIIALITHGWSNFTTARLASIAITHEQFNGIRQLAPVSTNLIVLLWAHPSPNPNVASQSVQPFLYSSQQNVAILYNRPHHFPPKIAPFHGGSGPPSNTLFLRPTRVLYPNNISIGSAVFAGLTICQTKTDQSTKRQTTLLGL